MPLHQTCKLHYTGDNFFFASYLFLFPSVLSPYLILIFIVEHSRARKWLYQWTVHVHTVISFSYFFSVYACDIICFETEIILCNIIYANNTLYQLATSRTSPSFLRRAKHSTQSAAKRWVSRNYILSRSIVLCFKVADCSRRTRSPKRDEEVPQTIHVHCSGHLRDVYLSQISLWKITSIWWYLQQRWGTKKPQHGKAK